MPVGAASFVAQGAALQPLLDRDDSWELPTIQSSASRSMDSGSAADQSGEPNGLLSNRYTQDAAAAAAAHAANLSGGEKQFRMHDDMSGDASLRTAAVDVPNGLTPAEPKQSSGLKDRQGATKSDPPTCAQSECRVQRSSQPVRGLLGVHPNAATARDPRLPGIGPLLPLWRSLAGPMAPVFHPVRASIALGTAKHVLITQSSVVFWSMCRLSTDDGRARTKARDESTSWAKAGVRVALRSA